MERIWVVVEQRRGTLLPISLELLSAARGLARTVEAFTWGAGGEQLAGVVGAYGATKLFDLGDLGESLAGPKVAATLAAHVLEGEAPEAILFGTTYDGRDLAARLSARLDRPVLTNAVSLEVDDAGLVSEHAVFGGTEVVRARFTGPTPAIFVVRPKSFVADEAGGPAAELVALEPRAIGALDGARVVPRHLEERSGPSLDEAAVVVAGDRGLGDAEHYRLVEELARLLGGAPAASRAIVDAGLVPYAYQVGQTGRTVKPEVYLAFGISGATQYLVGMKGAKRIVAVNKDAAAPILQVADLGVVGDLHQILPTLIEAIESRA